MKTLYKSLLVQVLLVVPLVQHASAAPAPTTRFQGSTSGIFTNNDAGVVSGIGTNSFSWGIGQPNRSNLTFTGGPFDVNVRTGYVYGPRARNDAEVFSLGNLSYFNGTISGGTGANSVQLDVTTVVTSPVATNPATFPSPFTLVNSPNTDDPIASADSVFLPRNLPPVVTNTPGNYPITLEIPGFGQTTGNGFSTVDRFFVLEEGTASAKLLGRFVPACEPIINGAVNLAVNGPTMSATFTPNFSLSLNQAAKLCGYDHFNWHQVVTYAAKTPPGIVAPFTDPPIGGGVNFGGIADNLPFYWDEFPDNLGSGYNLQDNIVGGMTLQYSDTPGNPRFIPGNPKDYNAFTTSLAGVLADNSWDVLYVWSWKSNFNGAIGGISRPRNIQLPDPGGTGGVFGVQSDLNPEEVSEEVITLMEAQGARNANVSSVPGPLPVLGIWTAFGMSRRIRERIKKSIS